MPSRLPSPAGSTARTIHSFLIASTLIVSIGALVATRSTGPLRSDLGAIDVLAVLVGACALLCFYLLRSRLPERSSGQSPDEWWRLHLGQAVLLWGLLEFSALLGAAALLATRQPIGFGVLALLAVAGLFRLAPARLAGE